MTKAIFLDFYGTVVDEDDHIINKICEHVKLKSANLDATVSEIGGYWWRKFSTSFSKSYGENFRTQRELELESIQETISHFSSDCNPNELSELLYSYWQRPEIFTYALTFLQSVELPVYILSNIDRQDILNAIHYHNLDFADVITSEDVRSYKPRSEMFQHALNKVKLEPSEVLHVGDSLTSDVAGACSMGIPVAWINRNAKTLHGEYKPTTTIEQLTEILPLIALEAK